MIQDGKLSYKSANKADLSFITGHVPKFRQYRQAWRLKLGVYPATKCNQTTSPLITSSHSVSKR